MSHSVEAVYAKAALIQEKALELHRERFKKQGEYNAFTCQVLIDDMRALALELANSSVNLDIDFAQTERYNNEYR
tara:strand:+ start:6018 stop:6242 length:225 start_codon:yes stop_codon:yes gene_type:complete